MIFPETSSAHRLIFDVAPAILDGAAYIYDQRGVPLSHLPNASSATLLLWSGIGSHATKLPNFDIRIVVTATTNTRPFPIHSLNTPRITNLIISTCISSLYSPPSPPSPSPPHSCPQSSRSLQMPPPRHHPNKMPRPQGLPVPRPRQLCLLYQMRGRPGREEWHTLYRAVSDRFEVE